jgi:hypothetical protein
VSELGELEQACQGAPPGASCGQWLQSLMASNPKCYDCLLQFTMDAAYVRCLAPYLTASCNHDLTCAVFCSNDSCGQCPPSQEDACQQQLFEANGQCSAWVSGYYCAQAAVNGPAAFCEFGNDVGQWIAGVGAHYCGK